MRCVMHLTTTYLVCSRLTFIEWQYLFLFFFFQAEDGIRDVAVTGVQTCALPISRYSWIRSPWTTSRAGWRPCGKMARAARTSRSEERRVGKECRSRWSPYH